MVDYCGVAKNLSEALAMYSQADREGVMRRLLDDLPTLEDRHRDVMNLFRDQLTGGRFVLPRQDQSRAAELFTRWYIEHASVWLRRRVDQLPPGSASERPHYVWVRDLGNHWGSCTESGVVNFHWR
ncbi:MAG: DUF45 domain-containing protein [Isosphaeraceae bacterium]|nr:DUF45 domain-containing protein [Isosphaeraceae bacterium]